MNSFYTLVEFIRAAFAADPDVHTITKGEINETDIDKKNIYPLCHFGVTGASLSPGIIVFNFNIAVLDQRIISKKKVTDKFTDNDNEIDNLNTTFAVINRFLTRLRLQQNDADIELVNAPTPVPIIYGFTNILDGWQVEIQLSIPNTINVC